MSLSWRDRVARSRSSRRRCTRCGRRAARSAAAPGLAGPGSKCSPAGRAPTSAVVASNRLVRYVVVPRTAGVSGDAEELALARHHFIRVHGERSRDWDVRYRRETGLASAVDTGLIEELRKALKHHAGFPATLPHGGFQPAARARAEGRRLDRAAGSRRRPAWRSMPMAAGPAWRSIAPAARKSLERERMRMGSARAPRTVLTPPGERRLRHGDERAMKPPRLELDHVAPRRRAALAGPRAARPVARRGRRPRAALPGTGRAAETRFR